MGRRSIVNGVSAFGGDRIQFDFELDGVRYRPTVKREPTEANLSRARRQMADIKRRIVDGVFTFAEEFPDYRLIKQVVGAPPAQRTCNQVFDEFLLECQSRVAKKDLAYVTGRGYRKLLAQIWRPAIGTRLFGEVRYSDLARIVNAYEWTKKTYNNAVSVIRVPLTMVTPVLLGLSPVFVAPEHPRLGDAQPPLSLIKVCHEQCDLLRRTKSGEEAQLIVVADRITPIGTQLGN